MNRTRAECEGQIKRICDTWDLEEAKAAFGRKGGQLSQLTPPSIVLDCDEQYHYGLFREYLTLGGRSLKEGIHEAVVAYYQSASRNQLPCLDSAVC
jgi:hypothetical protein